MQNVLTHYSNISREYKWRKRRLLYSESGNHQEKGGGRMNNSSKSLCQHMKRVRKESPRDGYAKAENK